MLGIWLHVVLCVCVCVSKCVPDVWGFFFFFAFLCQFIPRRGVDRARACVSVLLLA